MPLPISAAVSAIVARSTLSTSALALFEGLRSNIENTSIKADGSEWGMVYLDNVTRPAGMAPRQFAGHLSALAEVGLYKTVDGWAWGEVRFG